VFLHKQVTVMVQSTCGAALAIAGELSEFERTFGKSYNLTENSCNKAESGQLTHSWL